MNIVHIMGKIANDLEVRQVNGFSVLTMQIEVPREFRNSDGFYDCDVIPVTLWEGIAQNCKEYCSKGIYVCIKGRLVQRKYEKEEKQYSFLEFIGEKVSLLPNQRKAQD